MSSKGGVNGSRGSKSSRNDAKDKNKQVKGMEFANDLICAIIGAMLIAAISKYSLLQTRSDCTKMSVEEPVTIPDIVTWREDFNYSEKVTVERFGSCDAYQVQDVSTRYDFLKLNSSGVCHQEFTEIQTELDTPLCYSLDDCQPKSVTLSYIKYLSQFDGDWVLVGIEWELRNGDTMKYFSHVNDISDFTISSKTFYFTRFYSVQEITSVSTTQKSYTISCDSDSSTRNVDAIVGMTFYLSNSTTDSSIQWGISDCSECTTCVTNSSNATSFIYSSYVYGEPLLRPDGCGLDDSFLLYISNIGFYDFGEVTDSHLYAPNPNLPTPYPRHDLAFLYEDIYNASIKHNATSIGCSSDGFDYDNAIQADKNGDPAMDIYSGFLWMSWILQLSCTITLFFIFFDKSNNDGISKIEQQLDSAMRELGIVHFILSCIEKMSSSLSERIKRGFSGIFLRIIKFTAGIPLSVVGPWKPRSSDLSCFGLWDGSFVGSTVTVSFIMWCLGCAFVLYFIFYNFVGTRRADEKKCINALILSLYEIVLLGCFIVPVILIVMQTFSITAVPSFFSLLFTGVNLPIYFETLSAVHVDGISTSYEVNLFLGYQTTRLLAIAFNVVLLATSASNENVNQNENQDEGEDNGL